jgi:hypothetical protein
MAGEIDVGAVKDVLLQTYEEETIDNFLETSPYFFKLVKGQ